MVAQVLIIKLDRAQIGTHNILICEILLNKNR